MPRTRARGFTQSQHHSHLETEDHDSALELAARLPAAHMGGETRAPVVWVLGLRAACVLQTMGCFPPSHPGAHPELKGCPAPIDGVIP